MCTVLKSYVGDCELSYSGCRVESLFCFILKKLFGDGQ